MKSSLRERLSANKKQESAPAPKLVDAGSGGDSNATALQSMSEQLGGIYEEIDYMQQHFPDFTIKELTDHALSLQNSGAAPAPVKKNDNVTPINTANEPAAEDHGIIPGSVFASLGSITQEEADKADLGIVEVDNKGVIQIYNKYEQELAGIDLSTAHQKNFFVDIAPCTSNRFFRGKFKEGIKAGKLDTGFEYTFTYKLAPTPVHIHLLHHEASGKNYIFIKKM